MNNCLKKLFNNDININERICLMIDNSILLSNHYGTFNFVGGKLSANHLKYKFGSNSFKELYEELGIKINKNKRKRLRLLSWYFDNNNCLRLLNFIRIKKTWINFGKASHVWETSNFTLIPIDQNYEKSHKLGKYIEFHIKKNNQPCSLYLKLTPDNKIIKLTNLNTKKLIFKKGNNIFVKLTKNPILDKKDLEIIKEINKKITGYEDTKFIFTDDYICKFKYLIYSKQIKISVSKQFLDKILDIFQNNKIFPIFKIISSYEELIEFIYKNPNLDNINKNILLQDHKHAKYFNYIKILFNIIYG